jgi:hypothetical protein
VEVVLAEALAVVRGEDGDHVALRRDLREEPSERAVEAGDLAGCDP